MQNTLHLRPILSIYVQVGCLDDLVSKIIINAYVILVFGVNPEFEMFEEMDPLQLLNPGNPGPGHSGWMESGGRASSVVLVGEHVGPCFDVSLLEV